MRIAFDAWAQRDGQIVRRREDKPDEYLVFETQRRWVIWQAALAHGKPAVKVAAPKAAASNPDVIVDEALVRSRVLNEVLDAFSSLDGATGMEGILKMIQSLKKNAVAKEKLKDSAI